MWQHFFSTGFQIFCHKVVTGSFLKTTQKKDTEILCKKKTQKGPKNTKKWLDQKGPTVLHKHKKESQRHKKIETDSQPNNLFFFRVSSFLLFSEQAAFCFFSCSFF
jgi:hypothetical protein